MIGNVVEPAAKSELAAKEPDALFRMQIEREMRRQPSRVRQTNQQLIAIHHTERVPVPPLRPVDQAETSADWRPAPRDESIGRVPRQGTSALFVEHRVAKAEVEKSIRSCGRAHVRGKERVISQRLSQSYLCRIVAISSLVPEIKKPRWLTGQGIRTLPE